MENDKDKGLRKAVTGQAAPRLASNFTYRTMERIRLDTARREARHERLLAMSAVVAAAVVLGCCAGLLYWGYGINLWHVVVSFFLHIVSGEGVFWLPVLVSLPLLGVFNYWLRKKYGYLLK